MISPSTNSPMYFVFHACRGLKYIVLLFHMDTILPKRKSSRRQTSRRQTSSSSATPRKSNNTLKRSLSQRSLSQSPQKKRRKSNRLSNSVSTKTIVTYHLSKNKICEFVDKMEKNMPQIVNLPTPPENHAIFVNVVSPDLVMISDWGGNNIMNYETFEKKHKQKWKFYHQFIKCLEKKYANVKYYDVDEELYDIANEKHTTCQHGGCSEYLDLWLKKIYTNGNGYNTFTVSI